MAEHELRCWPPWFQDIFDRKKTAELRDDDRAFAVGDTLRLKEWEPATQGYTGREQLVFVIGLQRPPLCPFIPAGKVLLSIQTPGTHLTIPPEESRIVVPVPTGNHRH